MHHNAMVASIGFINGTRIMNNVVNSLAPSIFADSSRAGGIAIKLLRMSSMEKQGIVPVRIKAQSVLINFKLTNKRYVGIMPPEKNMVNTKIPVQNERCGNVFFERGKAVIVHKNKLTTVPNSTRITELTAPVLIYLYASMDA
jgi:hypothetical protein